MKTRQLEMMVLIPLALIAVSAVRAFADVPTWFQRSVGWLWSHPEDIPNFFTPSWIVTTGQALGVL